MGTLHDRIENYNKALARLGYAASVPDPSEFVFDSVMHRFELVFEMAWKLLKATLEESGIDAGLSPRDVLRSAFSVGYIDNDAVWLEMLRARNIMSHTYSEADARKVYDLIKSDFLPLLLRLGRRVW